MDFFTFMSSSASLTHYFYQCSFSTLEFMQQNDDRHKVFYKDLFKRLRLLGIEAEKNMFQSTKGINTHKGLVFSLGLMVSATVLAGYASKGHKTSPEAICRQVQLLVEDLCKEDFLDMKDKKVLTAGERLFMQYGVKGIRGQAEDGYQSVLEIGLPLLERSLNQGASLNDSMVQVLLHLMVDTIDTNILSRHNWERLEYVQETAEKLLQDGGILADQGMEAILKADRDFIAKNISPGGSADLLAVTIYLYLIQQ
jgi:triphosphoribosyl-dephospho-CoA synthase